MAVFLATVTLTSCTAEEPGREAKASEERSTAAPGEVVQDGGGVSRLAGDAETPAIDPVADPAQDVQWAAVKLMRGAYMVTALPGVVPETEGIAPVPPISLVPMCHGPDSKLSGPSGAGEVRRTAARSSSE